MCHHPYPSAIIPISGLQKAACTIEKNAPCCHTYSLAHQLVYCGTHHTSAGTKKHFNALRRRCPPRLAMPPLAAACAALLFTTTKAVSQASLVLSCSEATEGTQRPDSSRRLSASGTATEGCRKACDVCNPMAVASTTGNNNAGDRESILELTQHTTQHVQSSMLYTDSSAPGSAVVLVAGITCTAVLQTHSTFTPSSAQKTLL